MVDFVNLWLCVTVIPRMDLGSSSDNLNISSTFAKLENSPSFFTWPLASNLEKTVNQYMFLKTLTQGVLFLLQVGLKLRTVKLSGQLAQLFVFHKFGNVFEKSYFSDYFV